MSASMTDEMEVKLLPCPFCAREAMVVGYGPYRVSCKGCGGSVGPLYVLTETEAIAVWNRRALRPAGEVVAMRSVLEESIRQLDVIIEDGIPTDYRAWRDDLRAALASPINDAKVAEDARAIRIAILKALYGNDVGERPEPTLELLFALIAVAKSGRATPTAANASEGDGE